MDKKHISIIGSCVSRELFNTAVLSGAFAVDTYVFQRCAWDMVGACNSFPPEMIYKINSENFSVRMMEYSLNRSAISELKKANSEYLIIDLYNVSAKVIKLAFRGEVFYFQNTASHDVTTLRKAKELPEFSDAQTETLEFVDDELIADGLRGLAVALKDICEENKIIIYVPRSAQKYYKDSKTVDYSEARRAYDSVGDQKVERWSKFLHEQLPRSVMLDDIRDKTAVYGVFDDLNLLASPPSIHYSDMDQLLQAAELLKCLNIPLTEDWNRIIKNQMMDLKMRLSQATFQLNLEKKKSVTLNNYFSKIFDMEDVIVILTSKDDASNKIKYFRDKQGLPLKVNIGFRDSYIAIVDKRRGFVYEKTSQEQLSYQYFVCGKKVEIKSGGWVAGNLSFVSTDGVNNISKDQRGVNIVVLNSQTLEVVDSAYCDTFTDKDLKVVSEYFENRIMKV